MLKAAIISDGQTNLTMDGRLIFLFDQESAVKALSRWGGDGDELVSILIEENSLSPSKNAGWMLIGPDRVPCYAEVDGVSIGVLYDNENECRKTRFEHGLHAHVVRVVFGPALSGMESP